MMRILLTFLLLAIHSLAAAQLATVGTAQTYDNGASPWYTQALSKPTGTADGDFMVGGLVLYEFAADEAALVPTGFTERSNIVIGGTGSTESRVYIWTRDVDGTEGASFTFGRTSNSHYSSAFLVTFRGDADVTYSADSEGTPADTTSADAPSVAGTDNQGLIVVYALDDPAAAGVTQTEGMTLAVSTPENTGNAHVYYETLTATGSTGTRELTWTTARGSVGVSILVDGADSAGGGGVSIPIIVHHREQQED